MSKEVVWSVTGRLAVATAFVAIGLLAGVRLREANVQAQSRSGAPAPPQHFQSGGQRSELVLEKISMTLDKIDGRLERIEKHIERATQPPGLRPSTSNREPAP
jgi:hypothetical protein